MNPLLFKLSGHWILYTGGLEVQGSAFRVVCSECWIGGVRLDAGHRMLDTGYAFQGLVAKWGIGLMECWSAVGCPRYSSFLFSIFFSPLP